MRENRADCRLTQIIWILKKSTSREKMQGQSCWATFLCLQEEGVQCVNRGVVREGEVSLEMMVIRLLQGEKEGRADLPN